MKTRAATQRGKTEPESASGSGEARVFLIYGEDEYLVRTRAQDLVKALCPPSEAAFNLDVIDGAVENSAEAVEALRRCLEALSAIGLFAGRKVVWLRDATMLGADAPAEAREALEPLTAKIKDGLAEGQALVVSALKVDGRSAFFKACQAAGRVERFEKPDKPWQQAEYARQRTAEAFAREGLRAPDEVVELFIERVGADTRQIFQEATKLAAYLGGRKDVRAEDVRAVVCLCREAPAWDLADAVGERDLVGALRLLQQLIFQGENPVGLLAVLEGRFRELILLREALDRGWARVTGSDRWKQVEWQSGPEIEAAFSAAGRDPRTGHPYRVIKRMEQAQRFRLDELRRGHALLVQAHETLVSTSVPPALQLEWLLLRLMGPVEPAMGQAVK